MNANPKRPTNRLQFATLLRGVIVTTFLGMAGLSYVYLKNQLHVCCAQRKVLEQELHELISENNVMDAQIARLTSHTALQRRLDEGFIKLIPISSQALVRVRSQDNGRWLAQDRSAGDQIQRSRTYGETAGNGCIDWNHCDYKLVSRYRRRAPYGS